MPPKIDDPELQARLRQVVLSTWFAGCEPSFIEANRADIDVHAFERYNQCADHVVPWVSRVADLSGKTIVEVGSGTGSSTAAFAQVAGRVRGYDIDLPAVRCAWSRLEAMRIDNARVDHCAPEDVLARIERDHPHGTDVLLLYAVLEHQTLTERLALLRMGWGMLPEGGLLVVIETPNRLAFWDGHTSLLPFFSMLPDDLALLYGERSPRQAFADSIRRSAAESPAAALLNLARWGRGVSYHEFELTIGEIGPLIAASGYEDEMLQLFPLRPEEALLREFCDDYTLDVPRAFCRHHLNLVLQKGGATRVPAEPALGGSPAGAECGTLRQQLGDLRRAHEALLASRAVRLARRVARVPVVGRVVVHGLSVADRLYGAWRPRH